MKTGKQLAYTRVDFTNPAGDLVAYGCTNPSSLKSHDKLTVSVDHTKYVGKSSSHPVRESFMRRSLNLHPINLQENVKFSEDGESVIEGEDKLVD